MELFILSVVLLGVAVAGFAIKILLKPGGTFNKTCGSSFDPYTGKPAKCGCQSNKSEDCKNIDKKLEKTTD